MCVWCLLWNERQPLYSEEKKAKEPKEEKKEEKKAEKPKEEKKPKEKKPKDDDEEEEDPVLKEEKPRLSEVCRCVFSFLLLSSVDS